MCVGGEGYSTCVQGFRVRFYLGGEKKGSTAEIKYENTIDEISVSKGTYKAAEGTFLRSHKPSRALSG